MSCAGSIVDMMLSVISPDEVCPPVDLTAQFLSHAAAERLDDVRKTRIMHLGRLMGRLANTRPRQDDIGIDDPGASDGPALTSMMAANRITSIAAGAHAIGLCRAFLGVFQPKYADVPSEPIETWADRYIEAQQAADLAAAEALDLDRWSSVTTGFQKLHTTAEMFLQTLKEC